MDGTRADRARGARRETHTSVQQKTKITNDALRDEMTPDRQKTEGESKRTDDTVTMDVNNVESTRCAGPSKIRRNL